MESMRLIFKTNMLIYQSKANLDKKILVCTITHRLDPEVRKMLAMSMNGNKGSTFHADPLFTCFEMKFLFLKLTM